SEMGFTVQCSRCRFESFHWIQPYKTSDEPTSILETLRLSHLATSKSTCLKCWRTYVLSRNLISLSSRSADPRLTALAASFSTFFFLNGSPGPQRLKLTVTTCLRTAVIHVRFAISCTNRGCFRKLLAPFPSTQTS